jgi:hypothetical protein
MIRRPRLGTEWPPMNRTYLKTSPRQLPDGRWLPHFTLAGDRRPNTLGTEYWGREPFESKHAAVKACRVLAHRVVAAQQKM